MPRRQGAVSQRRQKVSRVWKELEEAARNGGDDESLLRDVLDRLEQLTPDADVVNALRPVRATSSCGLFCDYSQPRPSALSKNVHSSAITDLTI